MPLETFTGPNLRALMAQAETELGDDAVIVHVRRVPQWDGSVAFELLAADGQASVASGRPFLTRGNAPELTASSPEPQTLRRTPGTRPAVVAIVGPTGSGKTTTIAKLATNTHAFGNMRCGLLSLDTYRVGAVEQLRTYADVARIPLQVVHSSTEVVPALRRLGGCDVILVDTPGWGPRNQEGKETVQGWLARIKPDEVHLTTPAGRRPDLMRKTMSEYESLGVTHVLPTKLDEVPDEWAVFDLAADEHYPMRWSTNGQSVPDDLRSPAPRLLAALAAAPRAVAAR